MRSARGSQCSARIPACETALNLSERSVNGRRVRPAVPRAGCGRRHVSLPELPASPPYLHFPAPLEQEREAAGPGGSGSPAPSGRARQELTAAPAGPRRRLPTPALHYYYYYCSPLPLAFQFWQGIKAAPPCGSSDPETSLIHGVLPP